MYLLGLRKVKPYFFEYRAYAKGRWMKREILNVFKEEFQDRDETYYVSKTMLMSRQEAHR